MNKTAELPFLFRLAIVEILHPAINADVSTFQKRQRAITP